jgi:tRNA G18 (ribose-2'-O)-methylase SpoU
VSAADAASTDPAADAADLAAAPVDPLAEFRALNDPEQRREIERRGDFFVVEGMLALRALVESRYPVRSVLAAENRGAGVLELVGRRAPIYAVPAEEMEGITGFAFHRGVLATAARVPPLPLEAAVTPPARRLLVVEGVNDHENLGALFRNAAAFGIDAVILDPTTADPLYRRSVRVSMGHVLRVPWARVDGDRWPDALAELQDPGGFVVAALTPAADAEPIGALAAASPERLAFLVGAEGPGLSRHALAAAARRVRIPLAPGVDSLNVATAAAVALHRLHAE